MKLKPQESDFDGVYRWENIPMDTLAKIDKKTGDGFMINKPLYGDAVRWLSEQDKKNIRQVIFDVLDGKIRSKFANWPTINADWEIIMPEIWMENIYTNDNIKINAQFSPQNVWKNHNWIWEIYIYWKKYFFKSIKHWKWKIVPLEEERYFDNDDKTAISISAKLEYKWLEYIDKFAEYNKDVNIIKPIVSFDKWKKHFIIYPFVEKLQLLSDLEIQDPKLYSWIFQKYISYIGLIDSKWKVLDVKNNTNIYFDPQTQKIYIFDPVYNENSDK